MIFKMRIFFIGTNNHGYLCPKKFSKNNGKQNLLRNTFQLRYKYHSIFFSSPRPVMKLYSVFWFILVWLKYKLYFIWLYCIINEFFTTLQNFQKYSLTTRIIIYNTFFFFSQVVIRIIFIEMRATGCAFSSSCTNSVVTCYRTRWPFPPFTNYWN